jgi:hypothetical protein
MCTNATALPFLSLTRVAAFHRDESSSLHLRHDDAHSYLCHNVNR